MLRDWLAKLYGLYVAVVVVGVGFVLLAPVMMILPTLHLRRATGRLAMRLSLALAGVPFAVRGLERLPRGHCIVVSNHASYLDGPLMTAALPERFTFVVQHGAATWPWFGWIIRRMGVAFVNRSETRQGARHTRELIRRVSDGASLTVFPEGTFENETGLLPFRRGAFLIAVHAGVPVVPAVIRGTRRLFGGGRRLPRWSPVEIEILEPIPPAGDHRHAVDALRDATRGVVLQHCGEPDRRKAAPPDDTLA